MTADMLNMAYVGMCVGCGPGSTFLEGTAIIGPPMATRVLPIQRLALTPTPGNGTIHQRHTGVKATGHLVW
jgi:hypothetical protein